MLGGAAATAPPPDAEECRLVADLARDLARLDPTASETTTGTLEITTTGEPLPPDVTLALRLELCDPGIAIPDQGLTHDLPRLVRLNPAGTAEVRVLTGHYRLASRGHQARWSQESAPFMRLLQLDTDDWPREITIGTSPVRLPPVRIRLANEIHSLAPQHGSVVDLNEAEFRWRAVPGAASYRLRFHYTIEAPHPETTIFAFLTTTEPRLRLDELSGTDRQSIVNNLLPGRTGGWTVEAFDAAKRRIAVMLNEPQFLVATPLTRD
jgi:hypothetical protein